MSARIIIVGGGIGGLALAGLLLGRGMQVQVCEQAARLGEIGAGIQLSPNAMKVVRALGLEAGARDCAFQPEAFVGWDWKSGKALYRTPIKDLYESLYGAPYLHIHRADIHGLLAGVLPPEVLNLGARVEAIEEAGDEVRVRLSDGRRLAGDVLIGADGIHSVVRRHLFGDEAPRFTGNMCWRAMVDTADLPPGWVPPVASNWLGPHGHVVQYYVRGGRAVNIVAVLETRQWTSESWTTPSSVEELAAAFSGWHPRLRSVLERSGEVFRWGLFDRDPLAQWSRGRISLLGDAAHPMLPFLAQGAGQAIEDAYALAAWLAARPRDPIAALRAYEQERQGRTARVQLGARARGKTVHLASPLARWRRNLRFKLQGLRNPAATSHQAEWIYAHDVTRIPRE
ncbi:FAD-dependent monooxygenase [Bordetella hinzii]|uniref:Salicylate 1-monooxygenase n=2 Tax=Bordetella hinzii TaxID=103855 RepID=A0AAN1RZS7_9BORD|nr:FAD-dependent monooxygenase [Bordetella hinzii]AKQ60188.1 3-hydroxybenzoate 6-hydroxylase 1 [Bordetella hinzii]AZW18735.1 salicylate 1-monooxygenase [Bordetella hinzii]KCB24568.1 putative 3-hydroxybenzoate 6-monooxygenase [Bordetella hinzii OH87 BAL007II]KCB34470.1 putative 3-hydroxybenzoate 6-monooxygenase [Bordetella hinzii CA90 BAL1384]KCB39351.1 putative 3-hydroxybenzoate 6-monooxygenase [Bordetella hinzii 5132]